MIGTAEQPCRDAFDSSRARALQGRCSPRFETSIPDNVAQGFAGRSSTTTQLMHLVQDAFLGMRLSCHFYFLIFALLLAPYYYHLTIRWTLSTVPCGHVFLLRRCPSCCLSDLRLPLLACSSVALRSRPSLFSLTALYIRGHTLALFPEALDCRLRFLISIVFQPQRSR